MFAKPVILAVTLLGAIDPQPTETTPAPRYDVASIKPNGGSDATLTFRIDANGNLAATAITLRRLRSPHITFRAFGSSAGHAGSIRAVGMCVPHTTALYRSRKAI